MEALEEVEHRTVLVLKQPPRDVNDVIGRDADEVLVERAVVDSAQAQSVLDRRLAGFFDVADDVRGIEQAQLLEAADRALVGVCGDDAPAKARLVDSHLRLPHDVAAWRDHDHPSGRVVRRDEYGENRPVSAGPRREEVHERNLELVRRAESPVIGLVDVTLSYAYKKPSATTWSGYGVFAEVWIESAAGPF